MRKATLYCPLLWYDVTSARLGTRLAWMASERVALVYALVNKWIYTLTALCHPPKTIHGINMVAERSLGEV